MTTETKTLTRSQEVSRDVAALMRARNAVLWIVTREEARAERYLTEACAKAGYPVRFWDVAQGFTDMSGEIIAEMIGSNDPGAAMNFIRDASRNEVKPERCAWVMRDLAPWVQGPVGVATLRQLRNLARTLPAVPRDRAQTVIILSPSGDVPAELTNHATVIEWPLPDRNEIAAIVDKIASDYQLDLNGTREAAIDAAVGLSGEEAASCYAKSLVQTRKIDPVTVAKEKKRVVARERVLEWHDPLPLGLDTVGGLENLKSWLVTRKSAYTKEARAYGLPAPKGAVLVGVPGCGKSLTAKAIATAWGIPLLRLDLGALRSKYVGESEANIRRAFRTIEAIGRCVVWIDEIEKALGGASGAAADGGVSSDALGAVLNWMQERAGESFVIATANDVTALPPELLRKGRFDEIFFVDLPNPSERVSVLKAALKANRQPADGIDFDKLATVTDGFAGAEIAALVPDAMFMAFDDNARPVTTLDLVMAASNVAPLGKVAAPKIEALRAWAKGRGVRSASWQDGALAPGFGHGLETKPDRLIDLEEVTR